MSDDSYGYPKEILTSLKKKNMMSADAVIEPYFRVYKRVEISKKEPPD